jgi:hypothetical protein
MLAAGKAMLFLLPGFYAPGHKTREAGKASLFLRLAYTTV